MLYFTSRCKVMDISLVEWFGINPNYPWFSDFLITKPETAFFCFVHVSPPQTGEQVYFKAHILSGYVIISIYIFWGEFLLSRVLSLHFNSVGKVFKAVQICWSSLGIQTIISFLSKVLTNCKSSFCETVGQSTLNGTPKIEVQIMSLCSLFAPFFFQCS